jgi:hypothetical protein
MLVEFACSNLFANRLPGVLRGYGRIAWGQAGASTTC